MSSTSAVSPQESSRTNLINPGIHPGDPRAHNRETVSTVSLKSRLAELNALRAKRRLDPVTYSELGDHIDHSKSTVASIINGNYNAKTRWELEALLAEFIMAQLNELDPQPTPRPFFNEAAAQPPRERKPRTVAIAIPSDGRFSFRGRRYDAGFLFRGATQMVRFDRARNAHITLDRLTYCIEPLR